RRCASRIGGRRAARADADRARAAVGAGRRTRPRVHAPRAARARVLDQPRRLRPQRGLSRDPAAPQAGDRRAVAGSDPWRARRGLPAGSPMTRLPLAIKLALLTVPVLAVVGVVQWWLVDRGASGLARIGAIAVPLAVPTLCTYLVARIIVPRYTRPLIDA